MGNFRTLAGALAAVLLLLAWHWVAGWGLITIHADAQPVAGIIRDVERQGGVRIVSNLDPATLVTMHVDRVPLTEAMETLAASTDSRWDVLYVVAADQALARQALDDFAGSGELDRETWRRIGAPFGGMMNFDPFAPPSDPRTFSWQPLPSEAGDLHSWLQQASLATGADFLVPRDWNPALASPPEKGIIARAAPALAQAAGGVALETFLLRGSPSPDSRPPNAAGPGQGQGRRGDWAALGPHAEQLIEQRVRQQIASLPPGQRDAAQREFEERRALWQEIRSLPPDQQQAKIQELMQNDAFRQRMEERMMAREKRSSPEQRATRAKQYVQRREAARSGNNNP